jgi:glycosyltransferase involved in cell wall biosynthesis
MKYVTIIVPVFDEELIIKDSVIKTVETLKNIKTVSTELLIIDDGSTDKTPEILMKLKEDIDFNFTLIKHEMNMGIGGAIKTGIKNAAGDFIIFSPVDSPFDVETLQKYIDNIENNDVVIGIRKKRKGYNFLMKLNSFVYTQIIRFLFKIPFKDFNWIHLYNKKIFEKIEIEYTGIFMMAEILIKAHKNNCKMKEIYVDMIQRERGCASATRIRVILKTFSNLINYWIKTTFK